MKRIIFLVVIITNIAAFTAAQVTGISPALSGNFRQEGLASWYGVEFDGKPTASGEIFNSALLTAAHPTLPFGTILMVTNRQNMHSVTVRVNDRGPFVPSRIIDLSRAAAEILDMINTGTAMVIVEQLSGSSPGPSAGLSQGYSPPLPPVLIQPDTLQPAPVQPGNLQPAPIQQFAPLSTPATPPAVVYVLPPEQFSPGASIESNLIDPIPTIVHEPPPATVIQPPLQVPVQPTVQAPVQPSQAFIPAPPARLIGTSPEVGSGRLYRLQVGSFSVPRNAVDAFDRLKNAGLNPNYERHENFYRVVLANVRPEEIPAISQILGNLGIREAVVRLEN